MKHHAKAYNATDFGAMFRRERKALKKTQGQLAKELGCGRQTIVDLESGRNVGIQTVFAALAALGKAIEIMDARYEFDRMPDFMSDADE